MGNALTSTAAPPALPARHSRIATQARHDSGTTLVIFSGPTDPVGAKGKSALYHRSLTTFLQLGAKRRSKHVTTAVVITRRVAHLAAMIESYDALVFYRRNVCYDMESVRVVLEAMKERRRRFDFYIILNCGMFGPALPAYAIDRGPHWTQLITQNLDADTRLVGMNICCGGQEPINRSPRSRSAGWWHPTCDVRNKFDEYYCIYPHLDSSFLATDAEGISFLEEDQTFFHCNQTEEGPASSSVEHEVVLRYEMGASRSMVRRGYNLLALNMLHYGVDWRDESNAAGCTKRTQTCLYDDYPRGPPDQVSAGVGLESRVPWRPRLLLLPLLPRGSACSRRSILILRPYIYIPRL